MSKRGFQPVGVPDGLNRLAKNLPTQSVTTDAMLEPPPVVPKEPRVRLTMEVRESIRDELKRRAFDEGKTIQSFVMEALKGKGINIIDSDLIDKRSR